MGSGDVAEELGGGRTPLGDEHVGAGFEVVERVDAIGGGTEGRVGEDRDAAGLDGADDGGLVGGGKVGVDDAKAAQRRHGGGHGTLGDGVHRGGDDWGEEREPAREVRGEGNVIGGEVDVVREEDDVIVGVGVATVEELGGGETVLLHYCAALGFWFFVGCVGW